MERISSRPSGSAPTAGWRRWSRSTSRSGPSGHHQRRPVSTSKATAAEYTADALIIASGATARTLGLPDEMTYMGYGLGTCATCDGALYKGQEGRRRRRRRHGGRGGDLPHPVRQPGHPDPPPRHAPGLARSCRIGSSPTPRSTTPGTPRRSSTSARSEPHKSSTGVRLRSTEDGSTRDLMVRRPLPGHRPLAQHRDRSRASSR